MERTEYTSGKIKESRTLSICLRRIGFCVRIALMQTGFPWRLPFQMSANPPGV